MNEYIQGASLPDWGTNWYDADGNLIDFSSGWTFEADFVETKTGDLVDTFTGFTGSATSPNIARGWAVDDLSQDPGEYILYVTATRTSDNKKRKAHFHIRIISDGI